MSKQKEKEIKKQNEFTTWVLSLGVKGNHIEDVFLMQICRARKFDLEKCKEFYRIVLKNRMAQNYAKIAKNFFLKENALAKFLEFKRVWKSGYHGNTRHGLPIWIDVLGISQPEKMIGLYDQQDVLEFQCFENARAQKLIFPALQAQFGQKVRQMQMILDLNEFTQSKQTDLVKNYIQKISAFSSNSSPEQLFKNIIINAPMVFRGVWAIVKYWIDEGTRVKFTVMGSSFKHKLDLQVDDDNIADIQGGKSKLWDEEGMMIEKGVWTKGQEWRQREIQSKLLESGVDMEWDEEERKHNLSLLQDVTPTKLDFTLETD